MASSSWQFCVFAYYKWATYGMYQCASIIRDRLIYSKTSYIIEQGLYFKMYHIRGSFRYSSQLILPYFIPFLFDFYVSIQFSAYSSSKLSLDFFLFSLFIDSLFIYSCCWSLNLFSSEYCARIYLNKALHGKYISNFFLKSVLYAEDELVLISSVFSFL